MGSAMALLDVQEKVEKSQFSKIEIPFEKIIDSFFPSVFGTLESPTRGKKMQIENSKTFEKFGKKRVHEYCEKS